MFRRFVRILVAIVLILVFVSMLRLLRTAGDGDVHVREEAYIEHTYMTVPTRHQLSSKRPPSLNQVTAKRNSAPTDDKSYYNLESVEGKSPTDKPSTQTFPLQHGSPRSEPEPSHYSPDSYEHGVKDGLGKATDLLHQQQLHIFEKEQSVEYKPQTSQIADTLHSHDKIVENRLVGMGQTTALDAHFVRIQNGSTPMEGLAPALLGKQMEEEAFQEIQRHRAANRARQQRVHVESLNALKKQRTHHSVWDDSNSSDLGFWDILNRSYVDQHVHRPWIGSYQCKDVICSEFLHKHDWNRVGKCVNKLKKKHAELMNEVRPTLRPACHFMNGTSRGGVALLSFPGSGNTWLRGLLEKATGICTGSVYCDESIWFAGSVGEGIKSSNVLVVKSHNHDRDWAKQSTNDSDWKEAAILIIRNPFDAIVSFYKWSLFHYGLLLAGNNSHVSQISPKMFRNHPLWKNYVVEKKNHWSDIITRVVLENSSGRPILVVRYENMKRNRVLEVIHILDFLGVSYSPEEVKQRLLEDVTTFQRSKQAVNTDPYMPEQRELIREVLRRIIARLQLENDGDTLGIEEYLDSD